MSRYIKLELQKDKGPVRIKPGSISSFSMAPDEGSRVVTRQNQVYYVKETFDEVNDIIETYFINARPEY